MSVESSGLAIGVSLGCLGKTGVENMCFLGCRKSAEVVWDLGYENSEFASYSFELKFLGRLLVVIRTNYAASCTYGRSGR